MPLLSVLVFGLTVTAAMPATDSLVMSCRTFPATATLQELKDAFGSTETSVDSLALGDTEGDLVPATVLFPADSLRRIYIVWKDPGRQRGIRYVFLSGSSTIWKTPEGITLGTTLKKLERLNRRPFRLAGFGFDRSGAVTSWEDGRLRHLSEGPCRVRMRVDGSSRNSPTEPGAFKQVLGDRVFSSGHPVMQRLNPGVSELRLDYL